MDDDSCSIYTDALLEWSKRSGVQLPQFTVIDGSRDYSLFPSIILRYYENSGHEMMMLFCSAENTTRMREWYVFTAYPSTDFDNLLPELAVDDTEPQELITPTLAFDLGIITAEQLFDYQEFEVEYLEGLELSLSELRLRDINKNLETLAEQMRVLNESKKRLMGELGIDSSPNVD